MSRSSNRVKAQKEHGAQRPGGKPLDLKNGGVAGVKRVTHDDNVGAAHEEEGSQHTHNIRHSDRGKEVVSSSDAKIDVTPVVDNSRQNPLPSVSESDGTRNRKLRS